MGQKLITAAILVLIPLAGCKKEDASTSPPANQPQADVQREQLKVQKAALAQQQKDSIDREYREAIKRADESWEKSTSELQKNLDAGLISAESAQKQDALFREIKMKEHKRASDDATRKLRDVQQP